MAAWSSKYMHLFSLDHQPEEDFVTSQFRPKCKIYLVYRSVMAVYSILVVIASGFVNKDMYGPKILIWFTYWAYYMLTLCLIWRCFTAWLYVLYWRKPSGVFYWERTCLILKIQWVLVNIATVVSPIISIIFWVAIFDPKTGPTPVSINTHGLNLMLVILDAIISHHPVKFGHFVHSVLFCIVYALFTVVYWLSGGTNDKNEPYIYKILDYSNNTKVAVLYVLLVPFAAAPIIHCLHFLIYQLRTRIHNRMTAKKDELDVELNKHTVENACD